MIAGKRRGVGSGRDFCARGARRLHAGKRVIARQESQCCRDRFLHLDRPPARCRSLRRRGMTDVVALRGNRGNRRTRMRGDDAPDVTKLYGLAARTAGAKTEPAASAAPVAADAWMKARRSDIPMAAGTDVRLKQFAEKCMAEYDLDGWTAEGPRQHRQSQRACEGELASARHAEFRPNRIPQQLHHLHPPDRVDTRSRACTRRGTGVALGFLKSFTCELR